MRGRTGGPSALVPRPFRIPISRDRGPRPLSVRLRLPYGPRRRLLPWEAAGVIGSPSCRRPTGSRSNELFFGPREMQPPVRYRYAMDGSKTENAVLMGRTEPPPTSTDRMGREPAGHHDALSVPGSKRRPLAQARSDPDICGCSRREVPLGSRLWWWRRREAARWEGRPRPTGPCIRRVTGKNRPPYPSDEVRGGLRPAFAANTARSSRLIRSSAAALRYTFKAACVLP